MSLNLRTKLNLQFLAIGVIPMLVMASVGYFGSLADHIDMIEAEATSIAKMKSETVERYVNGLDTSLKNFAASPLAVEYSKSLKEGMFGYFDAQEVDKAYIDAGRKDITNYFENEFSPVFDKSNPGIDPEVSSVLNGMSDLAIVMQAEYIARNSNPLGNKEALVKIGNDTKYDNKHGEFHPYATQVLSSLGLYDLFLIDPKTGVIFYSVFKELDFATSLKSGPFASSNFAEAFNQALTLKQGESVLLDFKQYWPSYQSPASFLATPIYDGSTIESVLIYQMPLDALTATVSPFKVKDFEAESYILGENGLLRTDTYFGKEQFNLQNVFRFPEKYKIDLPHVTKAFTENTLTVSQAQNYLGIETIDAVAPVAVLGKKWAVVSSIKKQEVLGPIVQLSYMFLTIIGISLFLNVLFGVYIGKSIANPILDSSKNLASNADEVTGASNDLADAAAKLSELATEQAASIEETAASVEEISAMVKNNTAQAEQSSDLSEEVRSEAFNANEEMQKLIISMQEIIASNKRIEELVGVINEIGDKTEVIDEIVFQTKLLSFNASVEAERAGEHGRGFAVVAQEVGNLAEMSGNAALEIASMVKESIRSAETITAANREKVEAGNKMVEGVADTLQKIVKSAQSLSDQSKQIVTASREQAEGIVQVNTAMEQLDQATQQNSATAEQTATASAELKEQADYLESNVLTLKKLVNGENASVKDEAPTVTPPPAGNAKVINFSAPKETPMKIPNASIEKIAVNAPVSAPISKVSSGDSDDGWDSL